MDKKNELRAKPQPSYTIRLIPELDNIFDAMKQIKLLFDDPDVNMDFAVKQKLVRLFYDGLKLFSVNGHFDATTGTKDVIMRGQISQGFFDYMAALRTVEGEKSITQI